MEWQQLEYFRAVAEVEHFTRAAEQLNIAQPTLSRSIAKLEDELQVPLFDRGHRRAVLNRYGRMFYRRVARVLMDVDQAKRELQEAVDPDRGTISVAFLKSLGGSTFPDIARRFLQRHPGVSFQMAQDSTTAMLDQLTEGEMDFVLSSMTEERENVVWTHLWTEPLVAFLPTNHALSRRSSLHLAELAEEPFIALKPGYGVRTILDAVFIQSGKTPRIAFEGDEIVTIAGFVRSGLGVALMPKVTGVEMSGISSVPLDDPDCVRDIGIAWVADRYLSPVALRFREFVLTHYRAVDAK